MWPSGSSTLYYFCGQCDLNYPREEEFARCLKCLTPCAALSKYGVVVLTESEIKQLRLDHFEKVESPSSREERRARFRVIERERAERSKRFPQVIAEAGFQPHERKRIEELEAKFPGSRQGPSELAV